MFNKIKTYIYDRNYKIALKQFAEFFGPETEFTERKLMNLGGGVFKISDPGTDNFIYFKHRVLGPIMDWI